MTLDALLLQPPFFRLVGSHNDRAPLELAYLNGYLRRDGLSTIVLNADWTGAGKYIKWGKLFDNADFFERAVDGDSPLYDETIERVLSFDPKTVVVAAADSLTPWVDLGNAYFAAELSSRLRRYGVYTIGVGPFFGRVLSRFTSSFDTILIGAASPSIVDVVRRLPKEPVIRGAAMDVGHPPLFDGLVPDSRTDVFMTAIGCPQHCTFCMGADSGSLRIPLEVLEHDVAGRPSDSLDIGDAIFTLSAKRIYEIAEMLAPLGKSYACEVSAHTVTDQSLTALRALNVRTVKMGIEAADDDTLAAMRKPQTLHRTTRAVELIHKYGFTFVAYVLLGGDASSYASAERTLEFCRRIEPDDLVVNVLAYDQIETRDFRYDSHFSRRLARHWNVEEILPRLFELQSSVKVGLGPMIA